MGGKGDWVEPHACFFPTMGTWSIAVREMTLMTLMTMMTMMKLMTMPCCS
jgi:hypothetical protein